MNTNLFKTAIAALALLVTFNSCKKEEDEPFLFPADQVELLLADGAAVGTKIQKSDFYKTTLPGGKSVKIFYGKSADNITWELESGERAIDPFVKYYWRAAVYDAATKEYSDFSETRAFYSFAPIKATMESDNGETENAIVLRWEIVDKANFSNVRVQMTPTKDCGFAGKTFDVPDGQDSLYIKWADNTEIPYLFNDFDDEHGKIYDPVVYEFQLMADVQIADKTVPIQCDNKVQEIFLNKSTHVHDYEFNVYRLVKIGNQIWTADNFIASSVCYNNKMYKFSELELVYGSYVDNEQPDENGQTIVSLVYKPLTDEEVYETLRLPSGAETKIYNFLLDIETHEWGSLLYESPVHDSRGNVDLARLLKMYAVPKGFHISTVDDWLELERFYGVTIDTATPKRDGTTLYGYLYPEDFYIADFINEVYEGEDVGIRWQLSSQYDWYDTTGMLMRNIPSQFNAKPFGCDEETKGNGVIYYADAGGDSYLDEGQGIGLYNYLEGIIRKNQIRRACIRLVKDK